MPHRPHVGFGLRFFKKDWKEDEEAIFETRASHGASDEEGSQDLSNLRLAKTSIASNFHDQLSCVLRPDRYQWEPDPCALACYRSDPARRTWGIDCVSDSLCVCSTLLQKRSARRQYSSWTAHPRTRRAMGPQSDRSVKRAMRISNSSYGYFRAWRRCFLAVPKSELCRRGNL